MKLLGKRFFVMGGTSNSFVRSALQPLVHHNIIQANKFLACISKQTYFMYLIDDIWLGKVE